MKTWRTVKRFRRTQVLIRTPSLQAEAPYRTALRLIPFTIYNLLIDFNIVSALVGSASSMLKDDPVEMAVCGGASRDSRAEPSGVAVPYFSHSIRKIRRGLPLPLIVAIPPTLPYSCAVHVVGIVID